MRDNDSIVERVVSLRRSLDELKTAQFTSQDSGMKFIQIAGVETRLTLTPPSSYENLALFRHTFTPEHDEPVLLVPRLDIECDGATVDIAEDKDNAYHRTLTFYDGSTWLGYADVFVFYHETSAGKVRELISPMYYWFDSTQRASLELITRLSLRASDNGTASGNGVVYEL